MELSKRKYKKKEVEDIIINLSFNYETKLSEQRQRIEELIKETSEQKAQLQKYMKNEGKSLNILSSCEQQKEDTQEKIHDLYLLEVEFLRNFSVKWKEYFDYLKEKYPYYPAIENAVKIKEKLDELLDGNDAEKVVKTLDKELENKGVFNPKKKIEEYIENNSENGFNLDEVLHPGELHLEDICKELGLTDEK